MMTLDGIDDGSPHSLLEELEKALFNEKSSPILLPPVVSILGCILDTISLQEHNIADAELSTTPMDAYMNILKKIELERVKYLARSYIELRIEKINKQIYYASKSESYLMDHEKSYIQQLKKDSDEFLISNLYSNLPENMKSKFFTGENCELEDLNLSAAPELNCHITCSILEDVGDYMIDPLLMLSVVCKKGDTYRMPFKAALQLVLNGSARFI